MFCGSKHKNVSLKTRPKPITISLTNEVFTLEDFALGFSSRDDSSNQDSELEDLNKRITQMRKILNEQLEERAIYEKEMDELKQEAENSLRNTLLKLIDKELGKAILLDELGKYEDTVQSFMKLQ